MNKKEKNKDFSILNTFKIEKVVSKSEDNSEDHKRKKNIFHCTAMSELPIKKFIYRNGDYEEVEVVHSNNAWNVTEKTRLPLSNSHNIYDVRETLGSAYNFKKVGDTTECDIEISESEEDIINKINEGHINSVSIGGMNVSSVLIEKGNEAKVLGKNYKAKDYTLIIVTKANAWELALCQVPADSNCKLTKSIENIYFDENFQKREEKMEKEEVKIENTEVTVEKIAETEVVFEEKQVEKTIEQPIVEKKNDEEEINKSLKLEDERVELIRKTCENRKFSQEVIEKFINSGKTVTELKDEIIIETRKSQKGLTPMIEVTKSEFDNLREGLGLAFEKKIVGTKMSKEKEDMLKKSTIKPDYDSFTETFAKLLNMPYASPKQVYTRIMKDVQAQTEFASVLDYAVSASKDTLVANAAVADLSFVGEVSVPYIEKAWTLIDTNPIADIPRIDVGDDYVRQDVTTCGNSIIVYKEGGALNFYLENLINDRASFDIFADSTRRIMEAYARKDESLVTSVLTANAALSDSKALFHADHDNLSELALTAENIDIVRQKAVAMVDANGVRIGVEPSFLIVPRKLRKTALDIVMAPEYVNYNTNKDLRVIVLNGLDANSETAWYMAGPAQYGIVLGRLQGFDGSPTIETFTSQGLEADAIGYKHRRYAGCAAKSHFYLQKSTGVASSTEA